MTGSLTTILILLPIGGALFVWLFPLPRFWVGSFALLVSLVEVGFWIDALARFHFSRGLQMEQHVSWFKDLKVSYHVGFYGFSLWLAGLTVVVMACAIGYAFWAGREREPVEADVVGDLQVLEPADVLLHLQAAGDLARR